MSSLADARFILARGLCLALLTCCSISTSLYAKDTVSRDGRYVVYREDQSCALYGDFADNVMLRIGYRPWTPEVFVSVYGLKLDLFQPGGTLALAMGVGQSKKVSGFMATYVELDDGRQGVATSGKEEIFLLVNQEADLVFYGPEFEVFASLPVAGIKKSLLSLRDCAITYFSADGKPIEVATGPRPIAPALLSSDPSNARPAFLRLERCVMAAAGRFAKVKDPARDVAESAVLECNSARDRLTKDMLRLGMGKERVERVVLRLEKGLRDKAQLAIIRARSSQ